MTRAHYFVITGFAVLVVGFFTLLALDGCITSGPVAYDEETINAADQFRQIAVAYNQAAQKGGRRSLTAEDLKPFLKSHGDPDALLISPRDGKPIVIVPGVSPGSPQDDDDRMIVAYEQTGVNGKRVTVDIRGTVVIVSDDEFAQIKFPGGHTPPGR
jgi:hypothetical protein